MRTIIVRYFEAVIDLVTQLKSSNLLGVETYEDIHEALIPGVPIPKAGNPPPSGLRHKVLFGCIQSPLEASVSFRDGIYSDAPRSLLRTFAVA